MRPRALIDASSAILLAKAGLIHACCRAFNLLMTRSVFNEVTVSGRPGAGGFCALAERQPGVRVLEDPAGPLPDTVVADLQKLHQGERDTLQHYLHGAARFVIIDDGKGVQVCRRHGIAHVNALLCPKLLYFCGWLTNEYQVRCYLNCIADIGRYSKEVVAWAQTCGRSDLDWFIDFYRECGE